MSQFFIQSTGGGVGPLPPDVPTLFTTDRDETGNGAPGFVVPVENNVNVFGNPPALPFEGILTQSAPVASPHDTIYIHYANGFVTTNDDTPTTIYTATLDDNVGFTFSALFTGHEPATAFSFGGRLTVIGEKLANFVNIVNVLENVGGGSGPLIACSFNAVSGGTTLLLQVKGILDRTINWHVIVPWINVQG